MALTHCPLSLHSPRYPYHLRNSNPNHSFLVIPGATTKAPARFSVDWSLTHRSPALPTTSISAARREPSETTPFKLPLVFVRLAVSAALFLCFGIRARSASSLPLTPAVQQEEQTIQDDHDGSKHENEENVVDKELEAAFNTWKSKTYALTVPLKVVALRSSVPPSWIKDFISSQGRRMKFNIKYYASLESIFSDLSIPFTKGNLGPASALAADIVGIGDSWLKFVINKALIEPIRDVEDQEWF
ncbi:hypothetical protein SESBI_20412 [Sesbania bispinosa]|nr:hypothetical protein SESBI_20412 [Sesbania bispinosa]